MNIKSVGAALAIALLSTTAFAADLPSRRAPPVYAPAPPIPVFTWTGVYIGAQAGYEFGHDASFAAATANGAGLASRSAKENGFIGGAHIGYNFSTQSLPVFGSAFGGLLGTGGVFGIEGDVDGTSAKANYGLGGIAVTTRDQIQGSVRGRLGIAVDRTLFYATGGVAFGGLRNTYVNTITGGSDTLDHTRVGYTVGGGVEYAITNNWSLRAEYRYTDFGHYTDVLGGATAGGVAVRHHEIDNRVQGGFSYKFDTFAPLAPVVARY
ncbi:outer membrane protein [Beijerinckia sp. L45]|uniref:outer membrane protein n=1 Tax=Beijerinckia sp. L45 TaxID=1641855 RepID=UPI00131C17EC|nr:outer membrane beta-barrel protein [Beijerinckia sp. L45]